MIYSLQSQEFYFDMEIKKANIILCEMLIVFMSTFPIMSVPSGGMECGILVVRGYNLVEFSSWGIVFLSAPLLLSATHSKRNKRLVLICVLSSYIYALCVAYAWLNRIGNSPVAFHIGALLSPLLLLFMVLLMIDIDRLGAMIGCSRK